MTKRNKFLAAFGIFLMLVGLALGWYAWHLPTESTVYVIELPEEHKHNHHDLTKEELLEELKDLDTALVAVKAKNSLDLTCVFALPEPIWKECWLKCI